MARMSDPRRRHRIELLVTVNAVLFLSILFGVAFAMQATPEPTLSAPLVFEDHGVVLNEPQRIAHVALPPEVRGIYWTARTAANHRAQELIEYMREYGLNTVVLDVKMDDGTLAFASHNPALQPYADGNPTIADFDSLLNQLALEDFYRIARVPVMRDRKFAEVHPAVALKRKDGRLWHDSAGSVWIDPAAPAATEYASGLARELYGRGFDEIQFDYVRYPSDGNLDAIVYPLTPNLEAQIPTMQQFFKTVGEAMRSEGVPVSFDLFGMTFWEETDYGIGQRLVDVYPYADFVSPMVYPSHYPKGFWGYKNPALAPYEIVHESLERGVTQIMNLGVPEAESRSKFRPWLQDFDIGAVYTAERIEAQIKATRDSGASGWILWNARNVYEPANYLVE